MNAYLVRLREDQKHAREIVGFFVAASMNALANYVDECVNVEDCEYAKLPGGGLYWGDLTGFTVPAEPVDDAPGLPGGAAVTEGWLSRLYGSEELRWLPLESPDINDDDD